MHQKLMFILAHPACPQPEFCHQNEAPGTLSVSMTGVFQADFHLQSHNHQPRKIGEKKHIKTSIKSPPGGAGEYNLRCAHP